MIGKKASQALREIAAPLLVLDEHGTVVHVNDGLSRLLGPLAADFGGNSLARFVRDGDTRLRALLHQFSGSGEWLVGCLTFVGADGTLVEFPCQGKVLQRPQGGEPKLLVIKLHRQTGFTALNRNIQDIHVEARRRHDMEYQLQLSSFALDHASDAIFWIARDSRLEMVNATASRKLGYSREELQGLRVGDIDPDFPADAWPRHWRQLKHEGTLVFETRHRRKDGELFPVEVSATFLRFHGRELNFAVARDISERKLAEASLRQSERIFSTAFSSSPVSASIATAAEGRILEANANYERDFGWTRADLIGRTTMEIGIWPDRAMRREWMDAINREGRLVDYETIWLHKNGQRRNVSLSAEITELDGTRCVLAYATDITARKKAEEKINELAFFDQLTGLPNRVLLLDRLRQTMTANARSGNYAALLFIDLDNFKTLNDTLGHDMGDLLLRQVARRLTACVRAGDTVARLGGDEFVVMLDGLSTNPADAATQTEAVGEKVIAALNQAYQLKDVSHHSTSSIGATLFRGHLASVEDLLKQADLAMYKAKEGGRNTLRFFDPDMEIVVMKRAALEGDLRRAIQERQFLLHYQPQLVDGVLAGAEALVRWRHPLHGMVSPADFILLAEETGLIQALGQWVMDTACTQLACWAAQPELAHLTVAVNVSAHQFRQAGFVGQVLATLESTGANPQRLKLELTESALVANVEDVIGKMNALKAEGVGFALDDFGTGYSSLSYLKRLPLDQLKIDQSFVRDVLSDPNDASIATTIIALARSLGLGVIAEGVETELQREFLANAGCHAYQGYLFSRPLPVEDFDKFALGLTSVASKADT
jgi:diguanylate cyclase (GGDEF)-like protein/PAS domain S-box-containing protein